MSSKIKATNSQGKTLTIENIDSVLDDVSITSKDLAGIKSVDTLSDLRTMKIPVEKIWVSGYHTKNDGAFGSHIFRLKGVKTTETDNGGTVIVATIGVIDYVYELQYDGVVNVKWFGAKGDGTTDNFGIIENCIDSLSTYIAPRPNNGTIELGDGAYYVKSVDKIKVSSKIAIRGTGVQSTYIIIDDNSSIGFKCLADLHDLTICTVSAYASIVANTVSVSDLTGIGVSFGGDVIYNNIAVQGFKNGMIPYDGIGQLINSKWEKIKITGCGTGLDFTTTGTHTTSHFNNIYITNCETGMVGEDLSSSTIDVIIFEYCTLGANFNGSFQLSKVLNAYFENNTTPYTMQNNGGLILHSITLTNNTNPPIIDVNETVFGVVERNVEIGYKSITTNKIDFSYSDSSTPNTARKYKKMSLNKFPSIATARTLYLSNRETKRGALSSEATVITSNNKNISNVSNIIIDGISGTIVKGDSIVASITKRATGLYRIVLFTASTIPVHITGMAIVNDTSRYPANVTITFESGSLAAARSGTEGMANFDVYVTNDGVAIDEYVSLLIHSKFTDE